MRATGSRGSARRRVSVGRAGLGRGYENPANAGNLPHPSSGAARGVKVRRAIRVFAPVAPPSGASRYLPRPARLHARGRSAASPLRQAIARAQARGSPLESPAHPSGARSHACESLARVALSAVAQAMPGVGRCDCSRILRDPPYSAVTAVQRCSQAFTVSCH